MGGEMGGVYALSVRMAALAATGEEMPVYSRKKMNGAQRNIK